MTLLLFNLIVDGRPSSGLRPKSVRLQVGTSGICILPSRRRAVPILKFRDETSPYAPPQRSAAAMQTRSLTQSQKAIFRSVPTPTPPFYCP
ncbi:hypothetical protein K523DRAFT_141663 [Schizophyllum commune Tattone D]|nr:hypothetical protein K523DRAFT_141663 [Schizophyllum commune Tattone D]